MKKIRFNNDYNHICHEKILKRLQSLNNESFEGYGLDEISKEAENKIKTLLNNQDSDVHFLVGGTQTNMVAVAGCLRNYEGVISADTGHINVHETGAIENTGHKIIGIKNNLGKIDKLDVLSVIKEYEESEIKEHIVKPKMVYISFPTEFGTLYTKEELIDLYNVCKEHDLLLFVDGARLAYGLEAKENDVSFSDFGKYTDIFYIGGTKCGCMFGEALVINNKEYQKEFRSYIKQLGAMLSKGFVAGIQFDELFTDNLYFNIGKLANAAAAKITQAFIKNNYKMYIDSPTNQIFVIMKNDILEKFNQKYISEFEFKLDDNTSVVRFCTSFSTTEEDVNELIKDINNIK